MKVKNIYGPFYFLANLYSTEYAQEKHYYNSATQSATLMKL